MASGRTSILATGDITFRDVDPDEICRHVADRMKQGSVVIGHVETPHTLHPERIGVNQVHAIDPDALRGLINCGINVATLAGNHIWDAGAPGLIDTIRWLDANGVVRTGAGRDLDEARRPAIIDHQGNRIGVLSYNCTGPRDGWATRNKPGTAYVQVITHYDLDHDCPGGAPSVYTFPTYPSLAAMEADVRAAKEQCDVLVVALHKGILHTPIVLADFESPLSRAAINAGADAVIGHHAHILRGVEVYRGKPIFHGLSNFIMRSASGATGDGHPQDFMARRTQLYDFTPISAEFRFHPEAVHSMLARIEVERGKIVQAGYVPLQIDAMATPRVVARKAGGQQVFDYVEHITRAAHLNARFAWDGDEVEICLGS